MGKMKRRGRKEVATLNMDRVGLGGLQLPRLKTKPSAANRSKKPCWPVRIKHLTSATARAVSHAFAKACSPEFQQPVLLEAVGPASFRLLSLAAVSSKSIGRTARR